MLALGDLVGGRGDGGGDLAVQHPQPGVDTCGGRLHEPQRTDLRAVQTTPGDREVLDGALGLRAVQRVGGNGDLAHGVVLDPVLLFSHNASLAQLDGRRRMA